jgi:peptide-methionine (S)-S-oxide reductase
MQVWKHTHSPSVEEIIMRKTFNFLSSVRFAAGMGLVFAALASGSGIASAQEGTKIPAPTVDEAKATSGKETAVFAGGCFWGVQGVFQRVAGVENAVSGYAGGAKNTASYETVSGGKTGHAESVKITFDPQKVSYGHLLQIYFSVAHDPTQLNRQGPDRGTQYRSTVFPTNAEQARVAKAYIDQLNKARIYDAAIVTTIEPDKPFYPAENYHQDFLTSNPTYPYIAYNDLPKIENLKKLFPSDFRAEPVLVAKMGVGN